MDWQATYHSHIFSISKMFEENDTTNNIPEENVYTLKRSLEKI
jgi:hypothetical protein